GPDDCDSGVCLASVCFPPSCDDEVHNGLEGGPDCGGTSSCGDCADGVPCTAPSDCASGVCDGVCLGASCDDDEHNGDETDEDCGGPDCLPCGEGDACEQGSDCESEACVDDVCAPPDLDPDPFVFADRDGVGLAEQ